MSKQDRAYVRTAAALEQKYLGRLSAQGDAESSELATQMRNLSQAMAQYVAETNKKFTEFKTQTEATIEELRSAIKETESYNVTFYSEDGIVIASYIIKEGDAINPPITDVNWEDGNGEKVTFPYTPTEDSSISIMSAFRSNTDYLYESFGVDKATFPYVMVGCTDRGGGKVECQVYFSPRFSDTNGRVIIPTGTTYMRASITKLLEADISNQDDVCDKIVEYNPTIKQAKASSQPAYTDSGTTLYYTNDQTDTFSFVPEYLT